MISVSCWPPPKTVSFYSHITGTIYLWHKQFSSDLCQQHSNRHSWVFLFSSLHTCFNSWQLFQGTQGLRRICFWPWVCKVKSHGVGGKCGKKIETEWGTNILHVIDKCFSVYKPLHQHAASISFRISLVQNLQHQKYNPKTQVQWQASKNLQVVFASILSKKNSDKH